MSEKDEQAPNGEQQDKGGDQKPKQVEARLMITMAMTENGQVIMNLNPHDPDKPVLLQDAYALLGMLENEIRFRGWQWRQQREKQSRSQIHRPGLIDVSKLGK